MYKCIISDFDGTMASKDGVISDTVRDSIRKLTQANLYFSIATGKSYQGVIEKICQELNLTTPVIVRSGAEIVDPKTGEILFAEFINSEEVDSILKDLISPQKKQPSIWQY